MGVVMYVPSGRGAVPRVEAVERARAEGGELVDLLLLACVVFVGSVRALAVAGAWRMTLTARARESRRPTRDRRESRSKSAT